MPQGIIKPQALDMLKQLDMAEGQLKGLVKDIPANHNGVCVIMIAYHTGKVLFEAIDHVLKDELVAQFILIDNGSTESDAKRLRSINEAEPRIKLVQGHGNIGFGKAANLGAVLSDQPLLVFLNPDALIAKDCIGTLSQTLRTTKRPCLIGAHIRNTNGSEQRGGRRGEVSPLSTLLTLSRLTRLFKGLSPFEIHLERFELPSKPIAVPTVSGACFAMRREDFLGLNGFDPRFFLHVEDIDLCWRVRLAGGQVIFHPHAQVFHEGHTSRVEPLFVEWNKGMGLVRYFLKRAEGITEKLSIYLCAPLILGISILRSLFRPRLKELKP
jgi:N-acetylglucosaminyl-diphospho-decaprenol L-rhamnosyltransferase